LAHFHNYLVFYALDFVAALPVPDLPKQQLTIQTGGGPLQGTEDRRCTA
jgi:hypothetical protein